MTEPVFVDTNVLVYWLDARDTAKQQRASQWLAELWSTATGRISFQVLQEFYVACTHRRDDLRDPIRSEIKNLLAWRPLLIDGSILEQAWKLQDRFRLSFWDSLIVAAAKAAGCRWLLTEDLQAGQKLDGVTVVNPFLTSPGQLPS